MYARSSSLGLPLGFSSNKCVIYMNINFSWNFHQKVFTLTISFIVLNASIEFVLIYRPHPVSVLRAQGKPLLLILTDREHRKLGQLSNLSLLILWHEENIWNGGKPVHVVFNLSRSLLLKEMGAGGVTPRPSPSPLPYFPADPWIFHLYLLTWNTWGGVSGSHSGRLFQCTDKKENKYSSYTRKFRVEQLQSHIRGRDS